MEIENRMRKNCKIINESMTKVLFQDTLSLDAELILKNDLKSDFSVNVNYRLSPIRNHPFTFGILQNNVLDFEFDSRVVEKLEFLTTDNEINRSIQIFKSICLNKGFDLSDFPDFIIEKKCSSVQKSSKKISHLSIEKNNPWFEEISWLDSKRFRKLKNKNKRENRFYTLQKSFIQESHKKKIRYFQKPKRNNNSEF